MLSVRLCIIKAFQISTRGVVEMFVKVRTGNGFQQCVGDCYPLVAVHSPSRRSSGSPATIPECRQAE